MAYGQPFYTFPNGYQQPAYATPQMQNPYYGGQPQMPLNAQNQPINGFQQQQGQFIQQQPQQQPQPIPSGSQQGFPIKDIRFVTSDEAKAFIVTPNSNALLIDMANGIAYFKSADGVGQSVTECYKFTKANGSEATVKPAEKQPEVDMSQFITKSDIAALIGQYGFVTEDQYKSLQDELNALKGQIRGNNGGYNNNGRKQQQQNNG